MAAVQRYTLSLPSEVYDELRRIADERGVSITEAVRQCLKFGLVAMKLNDDPTKEIVIREKQDQTDGQAIYKETHIQFVW